MAREVWKYAVPPGQLVELDIKKGAQLLHAGAQVTEGHAQIWALVDPDAKTEKRYFRLVGTGHSIAEEIVQHVGTFNMMEGVLVFHIFEVTPKGGLNA